MNPAILLKEPLMCIHGHLSGTLDSCAPKRIAWEQAWQSKADGPKGRWPLAGGNAPGSVLITNSAPEGAVETVHSPEPPSGRMFLGNLFRGRCPRLVADDPSGHAQVLSDSTMVSFPRFG